MKIIINAGLAAVLATALVLTGACANIANDRTRTQTEGTLGGAGIGAVLGAALGAALGGRDGALKGAAIGAGVGAIAGLAYGTSVANKKEAYATEEEWLEACLAEVQTANQQAAAQNSRLKTTLASYASQGGGSGGYSFTSGGGTSGNNKERQAIEKELKESQNLLAYLDNTITSQEQVAASTGNKQLQAQIKEAKQQKELLERNNRELAAISNRIAM